MSTNSEVQISSCERHVLSPQLDYVTMIHLRHIVLFYSSHKIWLVRAGHITFCGFCRGLDPKSDKNWK